MRYLGAILCFVIAASFGAILDNYGIGHGSIWAMVGGSALGVFAPMFGYAIGKIISNA